jgi:hypothetical protein
VPTVPTGGELRVSVTAAGLMTMETAPVEVFAGLAESVAFTVGVEVPAVVGVPVSEQLLFRVRPAGTEPLTSEQL